MQNRRLSAIMFTDLAGYTAMMQEDEGHAKEIRDLHRSILEKEIALNDGKVLQYYGDGALSVFDSTISAAAAAVQIQLNSIHEKIPLRIGMHTGDVVIEDDGVFGDGVNIASRIESFAVAGSVMISDKVFDDLKNHPSFSASLMGEFELKNVKRPVEVYALNNDGLVTPHRTELKGKVRERIKSIAVLPFMNRSADPENEYFSDGITEELISTLAKSDGLKVISRTSSFAFKGKNLDVREIGKQLGVQSILEGSVRKAGDRVRINAQLSSTLDGYQLWADKYDMELEDIFEVQDEISYRIAQQLRERFASDSKKEQTSQAINAEAYNHYLKGLFYYNKWTPSDSASSIEHFDEAIKLEPRYSQAYSGKALAYSLMATTGFLKPSIGYQEVDIAAKKAQELDPENESAYIALCYSDFFYRWDFEGSYKKVLQAYEINPMSPDVNLAMSLNHTIKGEFEESKKCVERAREIDPLSFLITRTLADMHYFMGEYGAAIDLYDSLLERDPEFKVALEFKAWALLMAGDCEEATKLFKSLTGQANHAIKPFVQLGYAYALKGDKEKAMQYLDELINEANLNPDKTYSLDFATLYTGLGMMDEAFDSLRKCLDDKIGAVAFLNLSPIWKPLKKDPRFLLLLDEIGVPFIEDAS